MENSSGCVTSVFKENEMSGAFGTVRGTLFKSPELKTSKNGNQYSSATLRVKDANETRFWKVMAFKNAADDLMKFHEGDLVQAEGGIKIDTWEKDGTTRINFTLLANNVSAYQPPQKQLQSTGREASTGGPNLMQRYGEYRA